MTKILGIIAEYNPFHAGHAYQIREAMKASGADYCVAVMSGYFVQRGEPAIRDPFLRAEAALKAGISAVFEMPSAWSCASAEDFASYGVSLLGNAGCDAISFGTEEFRPELLKAVLDVITEEPEAYRALLSENLRAGDSFPMARAKACAAVLGVEGADLADTAEESRPAGTRDKPGPAEDPGKPGQAGASGKAGLAAALNQPNLILALEYLKANRKMGSPLKVFPVERRGAGYHDLDLSACYPSASALRKGLREQERTDPSLRILTPDDLLPALLAVLKRKIYEKEDLRIYRDVSGEIADRLARLLEKEYFDTYDELVTALKSRQYTYTRISRCLMHILLGNRAAEMQEYKAFGAFPPDQAANTPGNDSARSGRDSAPSGPASYARLLGFKREDAALLGLLKERSRIPIISKAADAGKVLTEWYGDSRTAEALAACRMFREHAYSAEVYQEAYYRKYHEDPGNYYSRQLVIL